MRFAEILLTQIKFFPQGYFQLVKFAEIFSSISHAVYIALSTFSGWTRH